MAYHHGNLREALLERAAEVIAEHGVEALSLRALARDLGVSHAAPSRHFSDRRGLLGELARAGFERSLAAMDAGAEAAGADPVARYRALGRAYVRFACDQPALFRAMNHPEVQSVTADDLLAAHAAWFSKLKDGAAAAQNAGWHPEADPEALIAFSMAAAMGAANLLSDPQWRQTMAIDASQIDGMADAVLDLVVHRSNTVALPASRPPSPNEVESGSARVSASDTHGSEKHDRRAS